MRKFLSEKGFTLVELVVVIAILGLLMVILLATLNPLAQFSKALDAQRKHDLMEIRNALDNYYNDKNCYPSITSSKFPFGYEWADNNTIYMKLVPQDPQPDCLSSGCYYYYYQTDINLDCPQWNILYARLAGNIPTDEKCAVILSNACKAQGYRPSFNLKYNFCQISGKLDCAALMGLNNNPFIQETPTPTVTQAPTPTLLPTPTPLWANCVCTGGWCLDHGYSHPCTVQPPGQTCQFAGNGLGNSCGGDDNTCPIGAYVHCN